MQQGTEEWHVARLGKVTGSNFHKVMTGGKTAETYKHELVCQRLTKLRPPDIKAAAIDWGHDKEPEARLAYSLKMLSERDDVDLSIVEEDGFVLSTAHDGIGCSVDGLVGSDGLIEIKCPFTSKNHYRTLVSKAVPREYKWQVYGNMWVTEREWCDFISFDPRFPPHLQCSVVRVDRDDEIMGDMAKKLIDFATDVETLVDDLTQTMEMA